MTDDVLQAGKKLVWDYWQALNDAPQDAPAIIDQYVDEDIVWQGPRPIPDLESRDAFRSQLVEPMYASFPDLKRDVYLFLSGHYEGDCWVSGTGNYNATFSQDWLGIPATGQTISMRFGEFSKIEGDRITEVFTLFDIVDLMSQAGIEALPPSKGRDSTVPPPAHGPAILLEPQNAAVSKQSLAQLEAMLFEGMDYRTEYSGGSMDGYWSEDMKWFGPRGIGSAFGLDEFKAYVQGPILAGHPDRIGGFHKARIAEGECAAMCGLKTLQGTHTGEFLGIAPTGQRVNWRIMDFYTLEDGLLCENWNIIDIVDACQQIGVELLPAGPTA